LSVTAAFMHCNIYSILDVAVHDVLDVKSDVRYIGL
jgi:hypothetical protein